MGKEHKWPTLMDLPISVGLFALILTTYGHLKKRQNCCLLGLFALNQLQNCSISSYIDDLFLGRTSYIDTLFLGKARSGNIRLGNTRLSKVPRKQFCTGTKPRRHLDFGIFLGCSYAIWIDPNFVPSLPNPEYPPLKIQLSLLLFYAKKKRVFKMEKSENIIAYLQQSKKKIKIANGQKILQLRTHLHTFLVNTTK